MTDNEIIKALERCPQHTECCYCNSLEECGNKRILTTSVFDLINRKNAEIERLQKNIDGLNIFTKNHIKIIRLQAIKEFAARLKEKATNTFYEEHKYVDTEDINNLVKEMTEVNENDRA